MQVENLENYGKDIISIQKESKLSLKKKIIIIRHSISFIFSIIKELNPIGFIRFIKYYKKERLKALELDWSHIEKHGISKDNLTNVISKEVLAKVLAEKIGMQKATELRNKLSKSISYHVFSHIFAEPEKFLILGEGDFLPPFKKYYIALASALERAGLEESEIAIDTKDCFQLNITYCAYYEVAKP